MYTLVVIELGIYLIDKIALKHKIQSLKKDIPIVLKLSVKIGITYRLRMTKSIAFTYWQKIVTNASSKNYELRIFVAP